MKFESYYLNDILTRKQNVFSLTFVFSISAFDKLLELNEPWWSIFCDVQRNSAHKPTKSSHQRSFFFLSSSDDRWSTWIAFPPASAKQEDQAAPQHNGSLARDCSMMRPENGTKQFIHKLIKLMNVSVIKAHYIKCFAKIRVVYILKPSSDSLDVQR